MQTHNDIRIRGVGPTAEAAREDFAYQFIFYFADKKDHTFIMRGAPESSCLKYEVGTKEVHAISCRLTVSVLPIEAPEAQIPIGLAAVKEAVT